MRERRRRELGGRDSAARYFYGSDFRAARHSRGIVGTLAAIGLGLSAAAGVGSAVIGSNAASNAASTQANAANNAANLEAQSAKNALDFNKLEYGNSLSLLSPFYNTGVSANSRLAYLMGLTPNQGLPPGVVNPNAPASPNGAVGAGGGGQVNRLDFAPQAAGGANPLASDPNMGTLPPNVRGGTPQPLQDGTAGGNSLSMFGPRGAMAFNGNGLINGGINPGNVSAAPGQVPIQPNAAGGTLPNPDIGTFNAGTPAGTATASTGGVVTANGLPEQVPVLQPGANPNTPGANTPGGFGSLSQGWNQTFTSPTNLTDDPGYNFRLQQGLQALQNSAAARGGLLSGGTAKSINDYAGGSASQEYQNTYNRALQNYNTNYNTFTNDQSNLFNRLQALAGGGQTSANQLSASGLTAANNAANIGLTSAGQIGQQYNNAAAATASGYVGGANAITGALGNATNSLNALAYANLLKPPNSTNPGDPSLCWIAEALYGVNDPRTHLMRSWITNVLQFDPAGTYFFNAYLKHGEQTAELVKQFEPLRDFFQTMFDGWLIPAQRWAAQAEPKFIPPLEEYQGVEYQR